MTADTEDFSHLDRAGRVTASVAVRVRGITFVSLATLVALSWMLLLGMASRAADANAPAAFGPGGDLLGWVPDIALPQFLETFLALCLTSTATTGSMAEMLALTTMWFVMSLAMMLPSAAPMIRTYCEIADTARRKDEVAVHPLVLAAGYLAVWLGASAAFAAASVGLSTVAAGGPVAAPALVGSGALLAAGLYQFSGLKDVCLRKCRNPFTVLFSRWSVRPVRILRLGVEQGIWCLGCCWALMLVMFAVGTANVFWMALLAVFTTVEKQSANHVTTYLGGAILLVWAFALFLFSI